MRWMFLGFAACAFLSLWGLGHDFTLLAAFIVLFANFATFCILYDRPFERARLRVEANLRELQPNSDVAHRLATATITPTDADRHLGIGPMTILNVATAIAAGLMLMWGIWLRVS